MEAKNCKVWWNKVMRAWGGGDKKVVGKLWSCSTPARVRSRQGILNFPGVGNTKARRVKGWGRPLSRSYTPPLVESVAEVGKLHPMTPGSIILATSGSGPQLPHPDIATHPQALPPYNRHISGCHLSSFLCLSEEYQVRVQVGTALGEAAEVSWDTIRL